MTEKESIVVRAKGTMQCDSDRTGTVGAPIKIKCHTVKASGLCELCKKEQTVRVSWPSDCGHSFCFECTRDACQRQWDQCPRVTVNWDIDVDAPIDADAFLKSIVDNVTRITERTKVNMFLKHYCTCPTCGAHASPTTETLVGDLSVESQPTGASTSIHEFTAKRGNECAKRTRM